MRIAVISDIHGNGLALETALAEIESQTVDQIVCLGDAIQGGPQPVETITRLRELDCPIVMGNADAWLLSGHDADTADQLTDQQRTVRDWSAQQLSANDQAFIRAFPPLVTLDLGSAGRLVCFHGSPQSYDDLILPDTPELEFIRMLGHYQSSFCVGGHTHRQQVRRLGDAFFFNPGSVGSAYDRNRPASDPRLDPWVEYAILTVRRQKLSLEFCRLPLDLDAYLQIVRASGRPYAEGFAQLYGGSLVQ